jgi:hypothetical protein
LIIIDFAIENHPNGIVFIGHRLASTIDINDAEPTKSQAHRDWMTISIAVVHADPSLGVVRATVGDRISHLAQQCW